MPGQVPDAKFRLKHGFSVQPDLSIDKGPGRSLLIGQNVPESETKAIYLGKQAETPYRGVWIDTRGAHVVYVMGKRRSGKTYTLGVLAEGLGASGWIKQGPFQQGILILDSMNVFLTMPYSVDETYTERSSEFKELRKWKLDEEQLSINLFHPRGTKTPTGITSVEVTLRPSDLGSDEWCGLFEVDPFADPLGHLITEVYAKTAIDGYIDSDTGQRIDPKPNFSLEDFLVTLERDPDMNRYHRDTRESLRRRLDAVRRLPIFSARGLDIRQLLDPEKISVLLLRDLDQQMRSVLVAMIIRKMMQLRGIAEQEERMIPIHLARAQKLESIDHNKASLERELAEECRKKARNGIPRSWVIIDEAHNYIPSSGTVPSRKPLKKYVDEGRNLGLSIVAATQQPSGLDPSIQRNADVLLIHALSHHDDINAAKGMVNTAVPSEVTIGTIEKISGSRSFETLVRKLPQGYAMASTDRANRLFPFCVRPRVTIHGGGDY